LGNYLKRQEIMYRLWSTVNLIHNQKQFTGMEKLLSNRDARLAGASPSAYLLDPIAAAREGRRVAESSEHAASLAVESEQ
jgi:hypothetical protein